VGSGAKPQPTIDFGAYWNQKVQLWWQRFFVDFPKNKCNFLHKNKLDIVRLVKFLTRRRPLRNFFPAAAVAIALYGSRRLW